MIYKHKYVKKRVKAEESQTWYVETGDMYGDIDVWAIILFEILYAGGKNLWTQNKNVFL